MADSRDKGVRGEYQVRDILRKATGLDWERVPGSGGYGAQHGLKGDVYLPPSSGHISRYAIEVKWYADEKFTSNIFKKTHSQIEKWWEQTVREAAEMNAKPILIFKKDRGDWIACLEYGDAIDNHIGYLEQTNHVMWNKGDMSVVMFPFEAWINAIELESFVK